MVARIYINDRNKNPVNDPERSTEYATGLNWSSLAPKGHASAEFQVARDIARQWLVRDAYELIVRDGNNIRWQGRLRGLARQLSGQQETITLRADGYYSALAQRKMRRRWVDNNAVKRLLPYNYQATSPSDNEMPHERGDGFLLIRGGFGDVDRTEATGLRFKYEMPPGTIINDFDYDVAYRTGEGFRIYCYNEDQAAFEDLDTGLAGDYARYEDATGDTASKSYTLVEGDTTSIRIYFYYDDADLYDQNDWLRFYDFVVRAVMSSFPSPNWYADEIIQDVLELGAADVISSNYTGLQSPGLAIVPFMTLNDGYETLDSIISRLAQFGDSTGDTWNFYVWDETGAADGLPRAYLTERSTADHEYRVSLADVSGFESEPDLESVANYIIVRYQDAEGYDKYHTGDSQSTLKDTASITAYGERHLEVDAGQSTSTKALAFGERWLANRKDPKYRGQFSISGTIRNKYGVRVPVTQIRAGERVYIEDWNGGETWFLREVQINADQEQATCIRDLPPNTLEAQLGQQKAGLVL